MQTSTVLSFKYTTSKGRDTYGYNIVTLYANGEKVARTCGGGYDMRGTCLGDYIKANYIERLKLLKGNTGSMDDGAGYYGLSFHYETKEMPRSYKTHKEYQEGDTISLDGACGESCMVRIAEAIGLHLEPITFGPGGTRSESRGYILTDTKTN